MSGRKAKPKDSSFHFYKKDGDVFHVIKFVESSEGSFSREAEYKVEYDRCDCKGFMYNGKCKHVEAIVSPPEGEAVSLSEARGVVGRFIKDFRKVFKHVELPSEPYERDDAGNVVKATIVVGKPIVPSDLFSSGSGAWEGCLKDNGLKVRIIIR